MPALHIFPAGHTDPAEAHAASEVSPVFVYILPGGQLVVGLVPLQ